MKIVSSQLQLESSQSQQRRHEITESFRLWVDGHRLGAGDTSSERPLSGAADRVRISDSGRMAQANETLEANGGLGSMGSDPKLAIIRQLLAMLLGYEVQVFDAGKLSSCNGATNSTPTTSPVPQRSDYGAEYDRHETYRESERMSFKASGVVKTADGQEIDFSLSLDMARDYFMESSASIRLGDAARETCDPLVINFSGNAAQLTDTRFAFDLDSDGMASENINFVAGGSGFLAFDKNFDGLINNGSELFGPRSGNGFQELAELDSDRNGWIDENDASYSQLSVWTKDETGNDNLLSLKEANVGAISLTHLATPFSIKDENNILKGQVRASGVYLQESGGAGSIQQIDLTV